MKKFAVLIYILALILVGCGNDLPAHGEVKDDFYDVTVIDESIGVLPSFNATVIETGDGYLMVEPDEGSAERRSSDRITVSTNVTAEGGLPDMSEVKVGDRICIFYDGRIMETYPAQLGEVAATHLLGSDGSLLPNN